jgi:phage N-6-adenine-methyltransferase
MSGFVHEDGWAANEKFEWYTPPKIFDALGLEFDLDPCSPGPEKCFTPAKKHLTIIDDGLTAEWSGLVWCNPPYGRHTRDWLFRMADHRNGIALVFARTGTKWFHECIRSTDAVCFIGGRLRFINGLTGKQGDSAGADSMLLAWGEVSKNAVIKSKLGIPMKVIHD